MISKLAVVETSSIGSNVSIAEFAIIRSGVTIGSDVVIHPHVVIESGVSLEDGVEVFPGSYLGKTPKGVGSTARSTRFEPWVKIGRECAIGPNAVIFYEVEIGHNTLVGDGASIREQCKVGHHCIISRHTTINYNTSIGNRTKIMDLTHITGNCCIGEDVFIGVLVSTANDNTPNIRQYKEHSTVGPIIQDRATIANAACILPNVTIGEGALVGASAVVARDVPPYKVAVGVPARVIRDLRETF